MPALSLQGNPTFGGRLSGPATDAWSDHRVVLNGNPTLRFLVDSVELVELPTVIEPSLPAGTENVTLSKSDWQVADFSMVRDLTILSDAGEVALPPGVYGHVRVIGDNTLTLGVAGREEVSLYELQDLNLLDHSGLRVVSPVLLRVGEVTSYAAMAPPENPAWLATHVATGDFKLLAQAEWWGSVVAPTSSVEILNATLHGRVAAARLKLLGNAELIDPETPGETL